MNGDSGEAASAPPELSDDQLIALGRCYNALVNDLASLEREHMEAVGTRTAAGMREAALRSLDCLAHHFDKLAEPFNSPGLPWQLVALRVELSDVSRGSKSPVLTPDTASEKPKGRPSNNRISAHLQACAMAVFEALKNEGWQCYSEDEAASNVICVLNAGGITRTQKNKEITTETLKEWLRELDKKNRNSHSRNLVNEFEKEQRLACKIMKSDEGVRHNSRIIIYGAALPAVLEIKCKALLTMLSDKIGGLVYGM